MTDTDKLTGFLTQKEFLSRLEEEVSRAKRYTGNLSLLVAKINYDYFEKDYEVEKNLAYTILKQLAALFRSTLRDVDKITRYEGDTIAILLPETNEAGAQRAAERLRERIEKHTFMGDEKKKTFKIAVSFGVAAHQRHAKDAKDLIVAAHKALQFAIAKGGNRTEICPIILEETEAPAT